MIKSILEVKSETPEILALAINLSLNPKNAAVMCADNGLKFLMKKALKTRSVLLFKLLRNIASHDGDLKMLFLVKKRFLNLNIIFYRILSMI